MRHLFLAAVSSLLTVLCVTACTLSIQPLRKPDPTGHGRVENVNCPPYFAPSFAPTPDLPDFTDREMRNDTLFKKKLARYTEQLQDYIDREHETQRAAWRAYARECHIL